MVTVVNESVFEVQVYISSMWQPGWPVQYLSFRSSSAFSRQSSELGKTKAAARTQNICIYVQKLQPRRLSPHTRLQPPPGSRLLAESKTFIISYACCALVIRRVKRPPQTNHSSNPIIRKMCTSSHRVTVLAPRNCRPESSFVSHCSPLEPLVPSSMAAKS